MIRTTIFIRRVIINIIGNDHTREYYFSNYLSHNLNSVPT